MKVIKLNTAKDLRKPDNAEQYILCKPRLSAKICNLTASDFRLDSEFVYKTVPIDIKRGGACAGQAHLKPLRQVVARTPVPYTLPSGWRGTYYVDLLSCGHSVTSHEAAGDLAKQRRGCEECREARAFLYSQKVAA